MNADNHKSIKYKNRELILKILCTRGPVSRIELSRMTGLSKMAITNIISEMEEKNIIIDTGEKGEQSKDSSFPGRKPILIEINADYAYALGVYISRDFCYISACNLSGELKITEKLALSFDESSETFIEKLKFQLKKVLDNEILKNKTILGIGVASIGPLDSANGVILEPPNFHNIQCIEIKEVLKKEFGINITVDNDMNASALAEKYFGKAVGLSNFIYFGITNGVGAGIITNNSLYKGDKGFGGEIGHTTINFEGPKCSCGNIGCLELYASIPSIVSQAKSAIELGAKTALSTLPLPEWLDIIEFAKKGDEFSIKLIDKLCYYISIGLVNTINIFDPDTVILGHDAALAGDLLIERLSVSTNNKILCKKYNEVNILISRFVDKAPIIGSCVLVLEKLFNGEIRDFIE